MRGVAFGSGVPDPVEIRRSSREQGPCMTSGDGGDPKALLNNSTFSVKTWSLGSPILSEAHHTLEQALLSISHRIRRGPGLRDGSGNACAWRNQCVSESARDCRIERKSPTSPKPFTALHVFPALSDHSDLMSPGLVVVLAGSVPLAGSAATTATRGWS